MITTKLEDLIWNGCAWYKTKVVGGTNKFNLSIQEDRFIIITGLTYQNSLTIPQDDFATYESATKRGINTQLTIIGERNINRYLFRNNFNLVNAANGIIAPIGSYKQDAYLMHTTSVTFSFSHGRNIDSAISLPANFATASLKSPIDYGKDGDPGVINSVVQFHTNDGTVPNFVVNTQGQFAEGTNNGNELSFPVQGNLIIDDTQILEQYSYPILLVEYVEVLGTPANFGI